MAVGRAGSVLVDVRGRIGDEVYLRTQGGLTIRTRVDPDNPASDAQTAVRAALAAVAPAWSATLTPAQRDAWRAYGHAHPLPNRWGTPSIRSGYCAFIRANATRYRIDDALAFPTPPDVPPTWPPIVAITADATADTTTIAAAPDGYTAPSRDLDIFAFAGKPVSPGTAYYAGPWRFIEALTWNTTDAWPGWTLDWPWNITAGQRVFLRLVAQLRASGSISTPYVCTAISL